MARRPPVSALSDSRLEEHVASVASTSAIGARAGRSLRQTLGTEDLFSRAQLTGARCSWHARSQLRLGSPGRRRRRGTSLLTHAVAELFKPLYDPTRCCTLRSHPPCTGHTSWTSSSGRLPSYLYQYGGPEAAPHEDAEGAHHQHQEPCALGQGPWKNGRPAADSALLRGEPTSAGGSLAAA